MYKRYYQLIGILILVVILVRLDFNNLFSVLKKINIYKFFLVNLLLIPNLFLKSFRWKYILKFQSICYSIKDAFLAYLSGIYAGMITPGRLGETVKAVYLKNDRNVPFGRGLATILIDRFCDLYFLLLVGLFGIATYHNFFNSWFFFLPVIFLFFGVPYILTRQGLITRLASIFANGGYFEKYSHKFKFHFEEFYATIKVININLVIILAAITLASYLIYFWQCYLLFLLVVYGIPFFTVMFFVSITALVTTLPVTFIGIGTREASLIYLFSMIGRSKEEAVCVSFLIFISFHINTAILGLFSWYIKGRV